MVTDIYSAFDILGYVWPYIEMPMRIPAESAAQSYHAYCKWWLWQHYDVMQTRHLQRDRTVLSRAHFYNACGKFHALHADHTRYKHNGFVKLLSVRANYEATPVPCPTGTHVCWNRYGAPRRVLPGIDLQGRCVSRRNGRDQARWHSHHQGRSTLPD